MSGKPKKDRNKSATSRPSTPQRLLDRATEKSTQIIGSLRARFQPSTSRSQSPLPKPADQSLPPAPVDDTLPTPTNDPTIPDTSEQKPVPMNDDVSNDLAITIERNFWKEAIESLTDEYESKDWLPKEWKDLECDGPELLSMVTSAKNNCLKSQWTIRIAGRTINVRECLTKIVDWVQKFAQVGDAAVQFDTAHAALPWAGFRFLLQVAVNEIAVYGGMLAGLERVSWLMWYTSAHECLFRTYYANNPQSAVTSSRFVIDLISLYKAVLRFLKKANEYYKRNKLKRVILSVVETDAWIKEMMATVDDQKGRLESYTDLLSKENIHADSKRILELVKDLEPAKQQIREIHQRIKGKEHLKFLKWISNIRYTDHHEANFHDVLPGTGQWLLDHPSFSDWMTSGAILWLHGIPGSGKTKLTSIVTDYLQQNKGEHIIAYFYCIRDTAQLERGKPEEILRAILKQLVCSIPKEGTYNPVENTYKRMKDEASQRGEKPRALKLEECVDLILEITSEHPATIIIDALDECQGDKRHELFEAFDRILQRADNPTRIFVSSRDDQDLVLRLENHQNILIGVDENALDIQSFVRKQIEEAIQRKRLLSGMVSPDLKSEIITKLEGGAGGMFRWVSLQVAALCNRDEMKTVEDVKNRLGRLPRDLHKLYDEIYERIKKMEAPELRITQTVLTWLLYAQRQLSADELLSAVSITVGSASVLPDTVLDLCFNLVTLNQTPKAFSFAHLSVREYLEGRMEYKPCPSHATIAKFCMERFVVGDTSQNDRLLNYARVYWPRHYENAADDGVRSEEIVKAASKFILDKSPNGGLSMWRSSSKRVIGSLLWNDDLRRKLWDAFLNTNILIPELSHWVLL
ncbi:hypothetical protein CPB86DRAFT_872963 [Serendipita vermifera]|nr:hypothetical protein CPB86DRAFT_872963 [Serendipita vermifera]